MRVLVVLLLLTAACESPRERSIRHFIQGEILSEELQIQSDMAEARRAAGIRCGGPVTLPAHKMGLEADDYVCKPPPAPC